MFYRNLDQPELDKIRTIKELLCVKYGLLSDLFYARVTVYFLTFTYFLYDFILNIYIGAPKTLRLLFTCHHQVAALCCVTRRHGRRLVSVTLNRKFDFVLWNNPADSCQISSRSYLNPELFSFFCRGSLQQDEQDE